MLRTVLTWIGSRRRGATAIVSAVAAVALAVAMVGRGCNVQGSGPESVVQALINAQSSDDSQQVYRLLGPKTKAALEIEARRATDLVGGWQRYAPAELVSIGQPLPGAKPFTFTVRYDGGDEAIVDIVDPNGKQAKLLVVRVNAQWRIEVPDYIAVSN